ncbi:putative phospholipase PldA [Lineolata rhizophorae]|uniref:Phospholipase n=1 Tax=Lineolata rhizophorae TaxID=578093 RepID=A0A6A6NXL0_9PEZI|nr:putative phospholipase PldA [Lineolata rhizophorae]
MATTPAHQAGKTDPEHHDRDGHHGVKEHLEHPFSSVREKLKNTHLYEIKKKAYRTKNKVGKLANLFNPHHRHDEPHEQETDEKRTKIAESHRFESFGPETDGNLIKWYIDGRDYFWAVSVALENAKEVIYIEDWWLSPELFLRRPPYQNQQWRLDRVLKRKAEQGVKIYVVVYKEVSQALTCNSRHTKQALMSLCPEGSPGHGNIIVMRHPDHNVFENFGDMTFYWAHHEKFIVIDYALAFIGGLDCCFGRWDARQHALADVHPSGVRNEIFPGQDFNNNRIMDFHSVEDWEQNELSKAEYGRMPWHDVAMGVIGPAIYSIAEHFVLRWNFVKRDKYKRDKRYPWLTLEGREGEDESLVGVQRPKYPVGGYIHHPFNPLSTKPLDGKQGSVHAQLVRSSADWSSGILVEHSIQNAYCEIIRSAKHYVYIENQFFITATGENQSPIHNQIGAAIVDAVLSAAKEGRKFRVIIVIPAIPGFAGDLRSEAAAGTRAIMDYQFKSINRGENSIFGRLKAQDVDPTKYIFFFNLRSYDRLNVTPALRRQEERSGVTYRDVQRAEAEELMGDTIHGAPGEADTSSDSSSASDGERKHHFKRRWHRHQHDGTAETTADETRQKTQDRFNMFEAMRGEVGLEEKKDIDSQDSIAKDAMLYGGDVREEPWDEKEPESELEHFVQEELYIHGKVMIVDDRIVICGSSNINDRSQLGFHDSELSIVMEDKATMESVMDGKAFTAGKHAATLRRMLWREHLGLLPAQPLDASEDVNAQPPSASAANDAHPGPEDDFVADPLSDAVWEQWTQHASTNTAIFRDLFRADPDDAIRTFDDYDAWLPRDHKAGHLFRPGERSAADVRRELDRVTGHLVWMPLEFLRDAEMAERGLQVNEWTESIYT